MREDGRRYHALEPDAYAWVHATLIHTYVAGHADFGTPMTESETERFYAEYRRLGRLIGVRERDLPETLDGLSELRRAHDRHEQLVHTESVDRVLGAIRRVPPPPVPLPQLIWRALRVPAADALRLGADRLARPAAQGALRGQAGQSSMNGASGRSARLSRALTPVLPKALTITGPAQLRWRQKAIARGPLGDRC